MVDADGSRQPLEVLRNAARGGQERFLVALGDGVESFDLAILDLPDEQLQAAPTARDPLAAWRELRPFTDLVLIGDGDPTRSGQAFAREVAAVLPKPLPEVDALLRAHIKRLAGFRRARTRGLLVLNAYGGIKDQLAGEAPELGTTLDA